MTFHKQLLAAGVIVCIATVGLGHSAQADPGVPEVRVVAEASVTIGAAYVQALQAAEIMQYVQAVQMAEVVAYVQAVEAEQQAAAARAQEALVRQRQRPVISTTPTSGTVNSGPHSDAWWQGVAMCEQGGRNDPYFGYFSFMDGSQGGRSWADQVAAGNALLLRAGREVGPWAASCVAAGYRASPSG